VRLIDIVPTVAELLSLDDRFPRRGESLVPLLAGPGRHRPAYCETFYREEQSAVPGLGPWKGLRLDNRRKVILDVNSHSLTLFDLEADPAERQGLAFGEGVL
jgi:hypothetical protein